MQHFCTVLSSTHFRNCAVWAESSMKRSCTVLLSTCFCNSAVWTESGMHHFVRLLHSAFMHPLMQLP
eukprot:scaffold154358_cov21-Tisochrysis_lutea.AAC.1